MNVIVKSVLTNVSHVIHTSRLTKVDVLKRKVREMFHMESEGLRLIFCGQQLEDHKTLFDYQINISDVIQLLETKVEMIGLVDKMVEKNYHEVTSTEVTFEETNYFKVGDFVDVKNFDSWFIGKIIKIKKDVPSENQSRYLISPMENDGFSYIVELLMCPEECPIEVHLLDIRPFSSEIISVDRLKIGDRVLMNYNVEYPKERGYWYDVLIKVIKTTRRGNEVIGDVYVGRNNAVILNCNLVFLNDIHVVKPYQLITERTPEDNQVLQSQPTVMRAGPLNCINCKDNQNKTCKECGCSICGGKDDDDKQLLCDECDQAYHMMCLTPPLKAIPEDDWYCPTCKNDPSEIFNEGRKLKVSKKKQTVSTSKRDWGNGMACVGRTTQCKIVPSNHFGPIPGIEVGTNWLFRLQVSESGVHRPPVGGIHGRAHEGAYSIILSGGYEDDSDYGNEFLYTGSGGRDLSGNKRTAKQSRDQTLEHQFNRALALNCHTKLNVKGAEAVDWKKGKPVRVVRNYKLAKYSKYAPKEGNRYDGLYKVVKYYPETGSSGFIVWRFVLRRDDPTPAPWTKKGKENIVQLGLTMITPKNYVSTKLIENKSDIKKLPEQQLSNTTIKQSRKSYLKKSEDTLPSKKVKLFYDLETEGIKFIAADTVNKKYWNDCKDQLNKGKKAFLEKVEETFLCICCQEIVFKPITTKCAHNICKGCLKRSFNAEVYQCPNCRTEMGKAYPMNINTKLSEALLYFFPAYCTGR